MWTKKKLDIVYSGTCVENLGKIATKRKVDKIWQFQIGWIEEDAMETPLTPNCTALSTLGSAGWGVAVADIWCDDAHWIEVFYFVTKIRQNRQKPSKNC